MLQAKPLAAVVVTGQPSQAGRRPRHVGCRPSRAVCSFAPAAGEGGESAAASRQCALTPASSSRPAREASGGLGRHSIVAGTAAAWLVAGASRRHKRLLRRACAAPEPLEPLESPFPLKRFVDEGLPPTSRFLWWEQSRCGRKEQGKLGSGLHALHLDQGWLEVAAPEEYAQVMAERRAILMGPQRSLAIVGGHAPSSDAERELLELIVCHLARCYPTRFELQQDDVKDASTWTLLSRLEGLQFRLGDFLEKDAPLLLAGMLVQEELCIMRAMPTEASSADDGLAADGDEVHQHIFTAGVVTESFDAGSKHMLPLGGLHEPVPGYAKDLASPMDRVFSALKRPLWRANFAFAQYVPEGEEPWSAELGSQALIDRLYLKVEYETLRRLPRNSDHLVFTIRTHFDPLSSLAAAPRACANLASELRRLPAALLAYRGLDDETSRGVVLSFLDAAVEAAGLERMPAAAAAARQEEVMSAHP
eukprot:TRINITY_DN41803_c0_g2_i1.p1 TRINITY_DN41803_c0_g2~~TRINITY_DN41803_c0_g2_i1.p1  ORF type:complete len:477 (-),score=121.58 TRINITY_DN41803_c0_g2_i1:17-1447(-)